MFLNLHGGTMDEFSSLKESCVSKKMVDFCIVYDQSNSSSCGDDAHKGEEKYDCLVP